ncbi:MAG: toxin-antitoxin system HicB family antitoxin [Ruminococcaceae bacterium]|nr:toxin-antitoxin system HicB family antitoxin [Oscillospiraceae bacterium]
MEFNPKKVSCTNRTVRMPSNLSEKLTALANKRAISFNQLVVQCCEFALEHLKDEEK